MNLAKARQIAENIVAAVRPFCVKIEIVGSIRRERPEVNDIDLVVLPSDVRGFKAKCLSVKGASLGTDGDLNFIWTLPSGFQIDVFFARPVDTTLFGIIPSNWGSLLVCRTGSKEHNIKLAQRALDISLKWNPYYGVMDNSGKLRSADTEESIFAALNLPFVPPPQREITSAPASASESSASSRPLRSSVQSSTSPEVAP